MSLIIEPKLHRDFKVATASQGRQMSDVLIEFIERYVADHLPATAPSPAKKGGR